MSHADHPNNGHLKATDSKITHLLAAAEDLEIKKPDLCLSLLIEVLEADVQNPTATQKWIVILNRFQEKSGIERVISIYKEHEAYIGGNPELLWNFGERLEESDSLDEAIKRYEAAASLQEDHRKRLNEKVNAVCPQLLKTGDSELSNGEYSKAITSFETVLKYKPDDLEAKKKLEKARFQAQIRELKSGACHFCKSLAKTRE